MKKAPMAAEAISIETEVWKRVLCWEDEPILHLSLQFPKLPDTPPGLRRIGRYYHQIAEQWKRRWEGRLYAQAQAAARSARGGLPPVPQLGSPSDLFRHLPAGWAS